MSNSSWLATYSKSQPTRPSLSYSLTLGHCKDTVQLGKVVTSVLASHFLWGLRTPSTLSANQPAQKNHGDVFLPGDAPLPARRLLGTANCLSAQAAQLSHIRHSPGSDFLELHFSENRGEEGEKRDSSGGQEIALYLHYNLNHHLQNPSLKTIKSPFPIFGLGCKDEG